MNDQAFTVLDLFCGAGGLSLGFKQAGFEIVCAVDNNNSAVETYAKNLGAHAVFQDLTRRVSLPYATVIAGGPPCQGFSSAGMRRRGDTRNSLVSCYAQIVARVRPKAFVFENVEGFLTAENGERILELLTPLLEAGYRLHLRKLNAANYGVSQHRKRVIVIGGLGWDPSFPSPTHTAFGAPGALLASRHLPLTPTVSQALVGLQTPSTEPPGCPNGHFYRPLKDLDMERAKALRPGMTMRDLPQGLHHESYRRRAFRRVMDGIPTEQRGGAPAGVRRLHPNEPSKAITSGARSEFLHPTEDRPLTLRECARIQTFPDDFIFIGSLSEQAQLIGNAVPPQLAYLIARSLASDLENLPLEHKRGAILSFVPTLSDGFSPALKNVSELAHKTFAAFLHKEELTLWP